MNGPVIERLPTGELAVHLGAEERELLRSLPGQLREVLDVAPDSDAVRRLRPPAYSDDAELEQEYRRLMADDLQARQLAALAVLEETVDADRLTEEQAQGWLLGLNSLRLVLGTRLDISEEMAGSEIDPDDPDAPLLAVYAYLSFLEDELVIALSGGLPAPTQD